MLFDFESHTSITTIHKSINFPRDEGEKQAKHANFCAGVQYPLKPVIKNSDILFEIGY